MSSKHCCSSSSFMSPSRALVIAGKDPLETSIEADSMTVLPTREQQAVRRRILNTANTPLNKMLAGMR